MTVRLALLVPRHAAALQPLAEDPAIAETSNLPSPYPPDGAAAFVRQTMARRAKGEEYAFAILDGARVAGACGLANVKEGRAELGYWVGRNFQGRGVATAAARLALRFAFTRLGLSEVYAHCLARNAASYRVLEKAGMRFTGNGRMPRSKWPTETVARFALARQAWRELEGRGGARSSASAGSTTRAGAASSTRKGSRARTASRTPRGSSARSS